MTDILTQIPIIILPKRRLHVHSLTIVLPWIFFISINVITIYPTAQVKKILDSSISFTLSPSLLPSNLSTNTFGSAWKIDSTSVYFSLFLLFSPWSKSLFSPALTKAKSIFPNPSVSSYCIRLKSKFCDPVGPAWPDPALSYDFPVLHPSLSKLLPHCPSRMDQNLSLLWPCCSLTLESSASRSLHSWSFLVIQSQVKCHLLTDFHG